MTPPVVALTIAGSDSGGGAGIVADLKTFEAHGLWGTVAITAVTAQNTVGVQAAEVLPAAFVAAQIRSVVSDIAVAAAKTGMLGTAEIAAAVADALPAGVPLVVDPVMVSKHGDRLAPVEAVAPLVARATVITPNLPEAEALVGFAVEDRDAMARAGAALVEQGAIVAFIKGGHLAGGDGGGASPDCVVTADGPSWLEATRIAGTHTHGTGCVLSAAVAAGLARGMDPPDACLAAKRFVEKAIAAGVDLGAGIGPVNPSPGLRSSAPGAP